MSQDTSIIPRNINNTKTFQRLVTHLGRGGEYRHLWTGKGRRSYWQRTSDPVSVPDTPQNWYFGVHPTKYLPADDPNYVNKTPGRAVRNATARSQTGTICAVNGIPSEFDAKDYGDKAGALAHIQALPLAPSVIIDSGGGYHCYWLLRETFHITNEKRRAHIDGIQKRWVMLVGGDPGAKDLARVLRVPGTRNYKPKYAPDFPPVTVIEANFDRLYDLAELEALLPAPEPKPELPAYTPPTTSDQRDRAARWAGEWFSRRLADLLATPAGSRNDRLYDLAFLAGQVAAADLLTVHEVEAALNDAAARLEQHTATVKSGLTDGLNAGAGEWIPDFSASPRQRQRRAATKRRAMTIEETLQPIELPTLDAHLIINQRYVSDLDPEAVLAHKAALIKSPLGTGKTELVKRLVAHLDAQQGQPVKALFVIHRTALAENTAGRLGFEVYDNIPAERLSQVSRLVITPNSLHKVGAGRAWDLVIIDEIDQVLAHAVGDTLRGGEAYRAHTVLAHVLAGARHVVGLDAHLSPVAAQWLHAQTGAAPYIIRNDHRHEWGTLTLHKRAETVIAAALDAVRADRGPVVVPVSSRSYSETLYRFFCDRLGPEGVMLINGENSSTADAQAFIRDINRNLPKLRLLITSPSLGTGLDVTAPVAGVFAVMGNRPLVATDMIQMLGRYRNAARRDVYIKPLHKDKPLDWLDLHAITLEQHAATRRAADFEQHGLGRLDSRQEAIARLDAQLKAAADQQRVDLVSYFAALARREGFTLAFHNGRDQDVYQAIRATADQLEAERKARTLAAAPVDRDDYRRHEMAGTVTPEIVAGYRRWKIEDTAGLTIDGTLYDDLHSPRQRAALRRFADLFQDMARLQDRDRQEAAEQVTLYARGHYTTARQLVEAGLKAVWGENWLEGAKAELTEAAIVERFGPFMRGHLDAIKRTVDRRPDLSEAPLAVFRRFLAFVGVKLGRRRVCEDYERFWLYFLDGAHLEKWQRYARARLAHLARQEAAATNAERGDFLREGGNDGRAARDLPDLLPLDAFKPPQWARAGAG